MTAKLSFNFVKMLLVVLLGLMMAGNFPANADESENFQKNRPEDFQTVGIVNPDGGKSVWLIIANDGHDISAWLAKFPSKVVDGLRFYILSSWQDTARFLTVVNEQQARTIRRLAQNMRQLNIRVGKLEKKKGRRVHSGSQDDRLSTLEEKVKNMSDGGYR
jgi:hypothetical protein